MTIETRIVAPIDDIKHVEVICPHDDCGGRMIIDLDRKVDRDQRCHQCNKDWWIHNSAPDVKPHPVYQVLSALISYRLRTRNGDPGIELILPDPS